MRNFGLPRRSEAKAGIRQWLDRDGNVLATSILKRGTMKSTHSSDQSSPAGFDSASDERTKNNVVRHEYRVLTNTEKEQIMFVKDIGLRFIQYCKSLGDSRELSIAKTKAEEAVMWAVKHITR